MSDHLTIDRGRIVDETPRHLCLVVTSDWPDENDVDHRDIRKGNPVGAAVILTSFSLFAYIVLVGWAAIS